MGSRPTNGLSDDVEAVLFDLDGTLLDRRRSFVRFARDQWKRFPQFLRNVDQEQYLQALISRDRDGYGPRKELFAGTIAQLELSADLGGTLLDDYRALFPSACQLFRDATQTLATLRAAGLKLGLITNGSLRMQTRKLECLGLAPMFDTVLISDAEGISKPDPRIFHRALARLGVDPARSVFVGDHPDVDIAGARAAGMQAIWRRDSQVPRPVHAEAIIDDLAELVALFGLP